MQKIVATYKHQWSTKYDSKIIEQWGQRVNITAAVCSTLICIIITEVRIKCQN